MSPLRPHPADRLRCSAMTLELYKPSPPASASNSDSEFLFRFQSPTTTSAVSLHVSKTKRSLQPPRIKQTARPWDFSVNVPRETPRLQHIKRKNKRTRDADPMKIPPPWTLKKRIWRSYFWWKASVIVERRTMHQYTTVNLLFEGKDIEIHQHEESRNGICDDRKRFVTKSCRYRR